MYQRRLSKSLIRCGNRSYKSYLTYFIPPLNIAREHLGNAYRNVGRFLRRELHQDFGMKELIERFYESIRAGGPPPIPYREIVLTARIMDEIFARIHGCRRRCLCEGKCSSQSVANYSKVSDAYDGSRSNGFSQANCVKTRNTICDANAGCYAVACCDGHADCYVYDIVYG